MVYRAHLLISSTPSHVGAVGPDSCAGPNDVQTVPLFQGDPQCFRRRTNNPTLVRILSWGIPLASVVPSFEGDRSPFFEEGHENSLSAEEGNPLAAVEDGHENSLSAEESIPSAAVDDREKSLSAEEGIRADNHFGGNRACEQNPFSSFLRSEARDYNFAVAGFCTGEVLRGARTEDPYFAASGSEHGGQIVADFDFDIAGFRSGTFVDFFLAVVSIALLDELVDVACTRDVFVVEFFLVSAFELRIFVSRQHFLQRAL